MVFVFHEGGPRREGAEVALERRDHHQHAEGAGHAVEERGEPDRELIVPGPAVDAEDRAQDDVERDLLHRGVEREALAFGPRREGLFGDGAHDLGIGLHARAVERRQEHAAVAEVLGPVEEDQRAIADQELEAAVGFAGVEDVGIAGEDLLDQLGIGEDDHDAQRRVLDRVHVAIPLHVRKAQRRGRGEELERLDDGG